MRGPTTGSMVRTRPETHTALQQLAAQENTSMQEILSRAVELYRRHRMLAEANAAYAALRDDPAAWQEELAERAAWDVTLMDGLEAD